MTRKALHLKLAEAAGDIIGGTNIDQIQSDVRQAIQEALPGEDFIFVESWFSNHVVYSAGESGELTDQKFTAKNGEVTLGKATKVAKVFQALESASEDFDIKIDFEPLVESISDDGSMITMRVIEPGQGDSAFYPADILKRDLPGLAVDGMKMYWDHPTLTEARERPERGLDDVAAVLSGNAYYDAAGPAGEGVYAKATVREKFRSSVKELGKHIGVSIRAAGKTVGDFVDGKRRKVVTSINKLASIDFVTEAGAGGKITELFEAARNSKLTKRKENSMDDSKLIALTESVNKLESVPEVLAALTETLKTHGTSIEQLHRSGLKTEAGLLASQLLESKKFPIAVREKITAQAITSLTTDADGKLDVEKFQESLKLAVDTAIEYGKAFGGAVPSVDNGGAPLSESSSSDEDLQKEFAELQAEQFATLGMSKQDTSRVWKQ